MNLMLPTAIVVTGRISDSISGLATKLIGLKSAVAAATGHNTFTAIDTNDITNLMAGVLAAAIPGAAWYTSATGYAQVICRLAAVSGGLVATQRPDGTISTNFLGFPVRFSVTGMSFHAGSNQPARA